MSKLPPPFLGGAIANPALPARPWTTHESEPLKAAVDTGHCVAYLPRIVDEATDLITWHEHAHLTWSAPGIFGNTEPGIWDHILDEVRVNVLLLEQLGVDVARALRAHDWSKQDVPLLPRDAGVFWINTAFYLRDTDNAGLADFAARLEQQVREGHDGHLAFGALMDAVEAVIASPTPLTRQTHAVKLAEHFAPPPPPPPMDPPLSDETADAIKEAEANEAKQAQEEAEDLAGEIAHQVGRGSSIDIMEIHQHLTHARPGRRLTAPGTHKQTGMIPEAFDRWCTDKALFRIRKPTGSLVIDCSGSMQWDWEALRVALKAFPNVVVACYQGFMGDRQGRLCVIAKKGRWSDYSPELEPDLCGANTVDYQALQWLAAQPRPRVWLSDGGFCGGTRENNADDISALMGRGKIVRIATLEAVLAYFAGKSVPAFTRVGQNAWTDTPTLARKR